MYKSFSCMNIMNYGIYHYSALLWYSTENNFSWFIALLDYTWIKNFDCAYHSNASRSIDSSFSSWNFPLLQFDLLRINCPKHFFKRLSPKYCTIASASAHISREITNKVSAHAQQRRHEINSEEKWNKMIGENTWQL